MSHTTIEKSDTQQTINVANASSTDINIAASTGSTSLGLSTDNGVVTTTSIAPGMPGVGVPLGGTDGQFLAKASSTPYDSAWEALPRAATSTEGVIKVRLDGTTLYITNDGTDA
jgi:hypothetical protein